MSEHLSPPSAPPSAPPPAQTQAQTPDVLIAGAGPVGLMLAGELARHGVSCRLVDQSEAPSDKSKAVGVHSRTLEIFEDIGVLQEALATGVPVHANNVYAGGRRIVHVNFDELDAPYPFVLDLPQSDTEAILGRLAQGRGVQTERRTRLTALAQDTEGVTATLLHAEGRQEQVRSRWLVGCDGAHSAVRHGLGLTFEGAPYDDVWMAADVRLEWELAEDEIHAFLSPEGALVTFPLPGERRVRVIYDRPGRPSDPMEAKATVPTPSLAEVQATMEARTGRPAPLSDPRWLTGFRIHRRIASSYRVGRVFLAGDAAHIHSPMGGQGMNTGIQDAYNLAWKLGLAVHGAAAPGLLDSYHAERHPIAAATVRGTDMATTVVTLRHPVARWARDSLAELLSGIEVVQARMLRTASQIAVGYRGCSSVGEHRSSVLRALVPRGPSALETPSVGEWLDFGAAPRPGDRAPDARYDGERRLFELLQGTRHTLLLFDGAVASEEGYRNLEGIAAGVTERLGGHVSAHIIVPQAARPAGLRWGGSVVLDPQGVLHRRYGAGCECLYLIRPDGYVGFRSQPADGAALAAHLAQVFA